jgi:tRNA U34 5-methylaminomethyl-2-thiouridine-forming methyltransferase MnmC
MHKEIILTEDGSHTLRVEELDECYHSIHGAAQESMHIFVNEGLRAFLNGHEYTACTRRAFRVSGHERVNPAERDRHDIKVLEIGFGTGLNAFLTLLEVEKLKLGVHYTALELYPLSADDALQLNYPETLCEDRGLFEKIHHSSWEEDNDISPFFTLHKIKADFTRYDLPGKYDVVYFDAFSPEKQPDMWSEAGFRKIYEHVGDGAVMTTYCAKGAVRRAMQSAGFVMERLPGPPGKREILRARNEFQFTNLYNPEA